MVENKVDIFFRKNVAFKDFERFKLTSRNFNRQFSSIYISRLAALKNELKKKAKAKWAHSEVINIVDLVDAKQDKFHIIIGTLYKHQELKPSILKELSKELQLLAQPVKTDYTSLKDMLFLEDEMLRVKLVGKHANTHEVVTGIVCAILGCPRDDGTFWVEDWCFLGCFPKPSTFISPIKQSGKILLLSGLSLVNNVEQLSLNLLSEWVTGMVGDCLVQEESASVAHIVIAGNSINNVIGTYDYTNYFINKTCDKTIAKEATLIMHRLDTFLEQLVQCCHVTLMPGEFDPTCHIIPQQPLHPCMLPRTTSRFKSFHGATNPWVGSFGTRVVAGSSGEPILDIMKVAGLANKSPLTWLEKTLHWRHYAPTAPDTVFTYPYNKNDPFIITECPDIYFVGNMEEYDTKLMSEEGHTMRLICIPKFAKSQTAVLVDLETLDTFPLVFGKNVL